MRHANSLVSIQEREREAIKLSEKYYLEKDPVKKKMLRYRIEGYIQGMLITTRLFCKKPGDNTMYSFENYLEEVKKAYESEDYMTVGDVAGLIPTKFRILEPLNPKPYEEPISGGGVIPQLV